MLNKVKENKLLKIEELKAKEGLEAVTRTKDVRRAIYIDAMGLFENRKADVEFEEVEIVERVETKYAKESHKKDKIRNKVKQKERGITEKKLGEKIVVESTENKTGKVKKNDKNRENNKKGTSMDRFI